MANGNNTASIGFEQQIWAAADILRGNMDAAEYKHVVLGLIFLKYISDKFDARYQELLADDDDVEDKDAYGEVNVFFVPPSARWSVIAEWAHKTGEFDGEAHNIGTIIDRAMRAIEKENKRLKDILPKNYARSELDKRRLGNVVDLFTNIQMIEHGTDKDILGRTYEYCLSKFAEQEGKRAGEFYTPSCVVRTLVEVLQPFKGRVYDPCCGSGGMYVQSAQFVENHSGNISSLSIYGQDSNPTTRKMALMNLAIRGIEADLGGYNADTFHNDLHKTLKADFILANPPFNLSDWNDGSLNDDLRWKYGLPPSGNANFAWLQHMISHLAPNGKIGMVLANGSLSSQSGGEGEIRKKIVEDDLVEGIIAMPTQLFYTTQIPVSLWFISRNKAQKGKTLFIDARKMGTMVNRRLREMTTEDISKIAATFQAFDDGMLEDVKGFCAAVTTADIAKQDYILTPGRYVGIEDQEDDAEPFEEKMARLTGELSEMFKRSHQLEDEIGKERIRRAGDKIKAEVGLTAQNLDIGFRVLKLDDTNMNDVYYAAGDYTQDLILQMESNIKPDRTDMDLLYGCLLDWGLPLSMPHTHEEIDGFTVHTYNDGDLIACFEERISEKAIREIASRKPLRAVFRDSSFNSSPEKINVFEIFKLLAPNTNVRVI